MSWHWRLENVAGEDVDAPGLDTGELFPTQSDAESWVGELWRELLDAGVGQVSLFEDERKVYGPMSLSPTE